MIHLLLEPDLEKKTRRTMNIIFQISSEIGTVSEHFHAISRVSEHFRLCSVFFGSDLKLVSAALICLKVFVVSLSAVGIRILCCTFVLIKY